MSKYSNLQNVQIIIALLKKYEINKIVISAGTRHTPLVHSVECDPYFECYSIVDERSASFFALGLIQETCRPVAICCTSATATCNYVSAVTEAYFQQLPLLVLTADRNPYYLYQQEEQMAPQLHLFQDMIKKEVTLPIVRDKKDFWYCTRIVNEALMELEHRERGPVHINFPVENDYPEVQGIVHFDTETLPDVKKSERLTFEDDEEKWKQWSEKLAASKVLIIYGQYRPLKDDEKQWVEEFCKKYNCVFLTDNISNMRCSKSINAFLLGRVGLVSFSQFEPDILITMNANSIEEIKHRFTNNKNIEHWHVSSKGEISDPFKIVPNVVEATPQIFFKKFAQLAGKENSSSYFEMWKKRTDSLHATANEYDAPIEWSSLYAVQQMMKRIPNGALFHSANSNSIRISSFFPLDESVNVYCNRGCHGIDGSMSAFIAQAYNSKKLSFLLIGDLSFFYDMNALWNRYVGNNVRILLCNNSGGAIFYNYPNKNNVPTLEQHLAAEHHTSAKAWTEDRDFLYLSAKNKEEFNENIESFMVQDSDKPIILEVFTDKEIDANEISKFPVNFRTASETAYRRIASRMPKGVKKTIKTIIKHTSVELGGGGDR